MNVVIAGGHGKVALRLAQLLHERGDQVISLIRNPAHAADVAQAGGEPKVCDLERADEHVVKRAIAGGQAIVFAAGAGSGSGPERKWTVDYGAAVKLIAAAQAGGIDRYVMLSSRGADPSAPGDDTFAVYLRAKGRADEDLQASGLAYTIVRPGGLTDDPGTARISAGEHVDDGRISRDDVAAVLAFTVRDPLLAGATFEVIAGEEPIEQALAACRSVGTA
jgi:uncharacterized protein YbjT (DUF2867 family)